MDTTASRGAAGAPAEQSAEGLLATEIRQSAALLGGALGLMGSFALLLLFLTTRL
jgi:hypothetical protein